MGEIFHWLRSNSLVVIIGSAAIVVIFLTVFADVRHTMLDWVRANTEATRAGLKKPQPPDPDPKSALYDAVNKKFEAIETRLIKIEQTNVDLASQVGIARKQIKETQAKDKVASNLESTIAALDHRLSKLEGPCPNGIGFIFLGASRTFDGTLHIMGVRASSNSIASRTAEYFVVNADYTVTQTEVNLRPRPPSSDGSIDLNDVCRPLDKDVSNVRLLEPATAHFNQGAYRWWGKVRVAD